VQVAPDAGRAYARRQGRGGARGGASACSPAERLSRGVGCVLSVRRRAFGCGRGGGDRRDPARRFGARRGGDQGRRRSRYRHGVHGHAAFPALTLPSAERTASPFGASRGGWTTPLIAAATTSSSRCGFCRQCCCKIWSAPFLTTMAPNKWSSIASELHVRWLH